ncbi:hypothetical protein M1446_03365 [Candidatus Dependentiae bacterium]|nr:hypothetical protein [Candidatus Dependentiae bacterium]
MKFLNVTSSLVIVLSLISAKEIPITIFIHGTISPKSNLSVHSIIKIFQDDLEKCVYKKVIEEVRQDKFFYVTQPIKKLGLKKINHKNLKEGKAANLFAHLYDNVHNQFNNSQECHYYTFGWSGLLSKKCRFTESKILYEHLKEELNKFKNKKIKLDIVGFSHGGNIALNLADIRAKFYAEDDFKIDNLILLGTPIQKINSHCINHDIFKNIYNFYSKYDTVQKMDFLTSKQFFSDRVFCNGFLPEKVKQVNIQVASKNLKQNIAPGHTELWFFGWTPDNYRKSFPLHPLPVAVFLPALINHTQKSDELKNFVIRINCHENKVTALNKKTKIFEKQLCTNFNDMCKVALNHEPRFLNKKSLRKRMYETKMKIVKNSRSQSNRSLKVAALANSKGQA